MVSSMWTPANDIRLENAADDAVRTKRNALVIAGPGAGKTELLAQRADYLFKTLKYSCPFNILAISFKKDAAANLAQRVEERSGSKAKRKFYSYTYDAFAEHLLDQFKDSLPKRWRPVENYKVEDKEQLCLNCKRLFNKSSKNYYQVFDKLLIPSDNLSKEQSRIWQRMLGHTDPNEACLTFKMISQLVVCLLNNNPKIVRLIQLAFPYVMLDEFQDTTDLQFQLVEKCFLNSKCVLTAVGDPKQRIMLWAGARKTIFRDFSYDFQAKTYKLLMNHRSAPKLIMLQRKMYKSLGEKSVNIIASNEWQKKDGKIQLFESKNENQEAQVIGSDILKNIKLGTRPENIVILVKIKPEKYTDHLITWLKEHGVKSRIENQFQDLLREPVIEIIMQTFYAALDLLPAEEWPGYMRQFFMLYTINKANCDEDGIWEDRKSNLEMEILEKYLKKLKSLIEIANSINVEKLVNDVVTFYGITAFQSAFPQYVQGSYFHYVVHLFINLLKESYSHTNSFKLALDDFKGKNTIPIMTIHKSKGLEYEIVYFIGLEDGAFWNFENQPDEDRSAFFVAISRAKRSLNFSFCERRMTRCGIKKMQHCNINEFFDLLLNDDIVNVIDVRE